MAEGPRDERCHLGAPGIARHVHYLAKLSWSFSWSLHDGYETRQEMLELERKKRIDQMQSGFARRLMQKQLSQALNSWSWQWAEKIAMDRYIRRVVTRIAKPRLVATFNAYAASRAVAMAEECHAFSGRFQMLSAPCVEGRVRAGRECPA